MKRTPASVASVAVVLAACTAPPQPEAHAPIATPREVPAPPPPPSASAAPLVSASEPAPAPSPAPHVPLGPPPAYGPDPQIPDATERAKLEYAKSLCPAAVKHQGGKVLVGCRACPPFDGTSRPDGKVEVDPGQFWPIELVIAGSYTRAGAQQVAVVMEGCESHAENYGGTLLAEREATYWNQVAYASGVHPSAAKAFRRESGVDLLVYRYADAHQGTGTDSLLAYDFVAGEADVTRGIQSLVELTDNSYSACWGLNPDLGLVRGEIMSFAVRPANGTQKSSLTVKVRQASVAYSAALERRVTAACKAARPKPDEPPTVDPTQVMGPMAPYQLTFTHDGTNLVPNPDTLATLTRLGIAPASPNP